MHVQILTPTSKVYDGEAEYVQLPGSEEKGSFAIMNNHAPIVSSLQAGRLKVRTGSGEQQYIIQSGFVEAKDNQVNVLVEGVEAVEE